ncbi:hypothetical protein [Cognatishimia sp. MH4019]|uniref:hypothetical protein n=1 Tax=Cognatishimia sp. MH4019 TaxID=2854030 RepID=UPI001CD4FCCD|nr:hypothetical protein [Cognatishimia sp. MH4019]
MKFDPYEFIAVAIPGALPTLTVSLLVPEVAAVIMANGVDLGSFGIFLIVSFVVGHVVQLVGNVIEQIEAFVTFGAIDMAVREERRPVHSEQWHRFCNHLAEASISGPAGITSKTWPGLRREVYARLSADGRTERIDMFNRTYGLCRGMVAGAAISAGVLLFFGDENGWKLSAMVVVFLALPLYVRMRRFSRYYFTETVSQFLSLGSDQSQPR